MKLCLRAVTVPVLTLLVVGCASKPSNDGAADASEDEVAAMCSNPSTYMAVLPVGGCPAIAGAAGTWVGERVFSDAPAWIDKACIYKWSSPPGVKIDHQAIASFVHPQASYAALTPLCPPEASLMGEAVDVTGRTNTVYVEEIPELETGSVGCDVCGAVEGDDVWAVLPPEEDLSAQFAVAMSDGRSAIFQIHAPPGTLATKVHLPHPPPGVHYMPGAVSIH